MIDLAYVNIVNAAFGLAPVQSIEEQTERLAKLRDERFVSMCLALQHIETRFAWYAEHANAPLLPDQMRIIALAIAETRAAMVLP